MHYSNAVFLLFFLKDFSLSFDHAKRTDQLKWPEREHYYKLHGVKGISGLTKIHLFIQIIK